ncbi:MAG: peptide-methionine (S)-S-oxide reductase MsrA [Pseudomonadota bacterium]
MTFRSIAGWFARLGHLLAATVLIAGFSASLAQAQVRTETAVFAGGCFWCVEADMDKVKGVLKTVSGYAGGTNDDPSYRAVTYVDTGHLEAVEVTYNPAIISYRRLTDIFLRTIDPTDDGGQFCDRGHSYRTALMPLNAAQRSAAKAAIADVTARGLLTAPVKTRVVPIKKFYKGEEYHQDFYQKKPAHYNRYRTGCRRNQRVKSVWGPEAYKGIPKLQKNKQASRQSDRSLFSSIFGQETGGR